MGNIDYLAEYVENFNPIKGFNDCMLDPIYRIGESYCLAYDYNKFINKVCKTKKIDITKINSYIRNNYNISNIYFVVVLKKKKERTRNNIADVDPNFLFCDGLDDALFGYTVSLNKNKNIVIYNYDECIEIFMSNGMDYEEAVEFMSYNTMDSYVGEYTPGFLESK